MTLPLLLGTVVTLAACSGSGPASNAALALPTTTPTSGAAASMMADPAPGAMSPAGAAAPSASPAKSRKKAAAAPKASPRPAATPRASRAAVPGATPTPTPAPSTSASPVPSDQVPGPSPTPKPAPPAKPPATATAQEAEVLRLTNAERAKASCPALRPNPVLAAVARAHSQDMALHSYFEHNSQDGTTPFVRMTRAGYQFTMAAENIAAGQPTPQSVVTAWMNSPGHRANILNCKLVDLGVGLYRSSSSSYGVYWTEDFGTPRKAA